MFLKIASLLAAQAGGIIAAQQAHLNSLLVRQFDHWALWVVLGTEAGCALFLAGLLVALVSWRRAWQGRLQAMEADSHRKSTALERQLADSRRSGIQQQILNAEVQQRATSLEASNSQLQAELDKLRKAEKSLSQERQTLESSKAVLEVHVQARTRELQKLHRRYELILNSAGEGICGLDAEGKTGQTVAAYYWEASECQALFVDVTGNKAATLDHAGDIHLRAAGQRTHTLPGTASRRDFAAALFDPEGRWLCAAGRADITAVYEVGTGRLKFALAHDVFGGTFSPEGDRLVTFGPERLIRLWNVAQARELRILRGHLSTPTLTAFSRDGRFIATAASDGMSNCGRAGQDAS